MALISTTQDKNEPNAIGFYVQDAARTGDLNYLKKQVIEFGANVNQDVFGGITPLHTACRLGHYDIVLYLLDCGATVDAYTMDRTTPLCEAAAAGQAKVVKLLLSQGATVNPPLLLSSPLHEAVLRSNMEDGCVSVMSLLLQHGADVNCNDSHHGTPLHAACSKKKPTVEAVKMLLEAGSNPNAIQYHRTPLHLIANRSKCLECASLLIYYGAHLQLRDSHNRRPIDLVMKGSALYSLMEEAESNPPSLEHICRLAARRSIGRHIRRLEKLNLPYAIKRLLR